MSPPPSGVGGSKEIPRPSTQGRPSSRGLSKPASQSADYAETPPIPHPAKGPASPQTDREPSSRDAPAIREIGSAGPPIPYRRPASSTKPPPEIPATTYPPPSSSQSACRRCGLTFLLMRGSAMDGFCLSPSHQEPPTPFDAAPD